MTGRSKLSCNDVPGAVAEAPFAIIKDAPAAPNAGKAILRCFRFEARFACAMVEPFCRCGPIQPYPSLDPHMPSDEVGHVPHAQKSLRTCERIQITNDLVSNK